MKGLEFVAVAVVNVSDEMVPAPWELTPAAVDPKQREADEMRERCLFYVACTRAREHLWVGWSGQPSPFLEAVLP